MSLPTRTYAVMLPVWSMNGAYLPNSECSETPLRSLSMKCDIQRIELCTRDVEHKYGSVKKSIVVSWMKGKQVHSIIWRDELFPSK